MTETVILKYGKLHGYHSLSESSEVLAEQTFYNHDKEILIKLIKNLRRPYSMYSDFTMRNFKTKQEVYEYIERENP